MKTLKLLQHNLLYILLACILLASCDETDNEFRKEPSVFIVVKAYQRDGMSETTNMMYYEVDMPDKSRLGSTSFIFCDTLNKYKVGDVLYLNLR